MKTISWFGIVLCALSAAGKVFFIKVGQKVTLDCGVGEFRHSVEWKHGENTVLREEIKRRLPTRGIVQKSITKRSRIIKTSLKISGVNEEDAGAFTCLVDGQGHQHELVVVSVWVEPSGVLLVDSTAGVHCKVNSLDQSYTAKLLRPDGSETTSQTELKPVTFSHNGTWTCIVTNDGETFSTHLIISVKDPAPKTTPPSSLKPLANPCISCNDTNQPPGLSWWVLVALGVSLLVVIVLIISVIVTCKKVRRRKRKFLNMKNAQQQQRTKKYCQCERQTAAAKPQQGRRREKPSALPLQPLLQE